MVQWSGRQGVGSGIGEDQEIDVGILYKRMGVMPFTIKDKNNAYDGGEDQKWSN